MAEDCVKFLEKDVSKPSIQVLPKSGSVAPAPNQPSVDGAGSISSLNSAAFPEVVVPVESQLLSSGEDNKTNMTSQFAKGSINSQHPLQNINNCNSMSVTVGSSAGPAPPAHQSVASSNNINANNW